MSSSTSSSPFKHFATNALHVGQDPERWNSHAVIPPISVSTTYKQTSVGVVKMYDYGRAGNPTRTCLEECLASLEGAKFARAFASGLAATQAIFTLMQSGDHIMCADDVYGGTNRFIKRIASRQGITHVRVDFSNLEMIKSKLTPNLTLVWVETPSNPLMKLCDLKGMVEAVRGVAPKAVIVVDNTFMTPYFQRPLDFGADMVVHSITKYINGHSDVIMGSVMTNSEEHRDHLNFMQIAAGAIPSPFDCFLVNRGIKTLHVRMRTHEHNAMAIADFLHGHPCVQKLIFPAHPTHPQHELHKRQCKGMSGMLSFYLKGGLEETKKFLSSVKVFMLAESLGGYESLVDHPAIMTHASVPAEERHELGIDDNLVRLSVGLEELEDLIEDLDQALRASCA